MQHTPSSFNKSFPMKKQIVRISIIQSSKIIVALYFLLGFLYTLIGIPMFFMGGQRIKIIAMVYFFGPVWMAVVGFVFFAITAAVYNLLAGMVGGFEFEVRDVDQIPLPPLPQ